MPDHDTPRRNRRKPARGVRGFAVLSGFDAAIRGMLISVFPLELYRHFESASVVSGVYFGIGFLSLVVGLAVPWITRVVPRRWTYTLGTGLFLTGQAAGIAGGALMPLAVLANSLGTVVVFVCLNAYILDNINKADLGETESLRMFYAALGWVAGPLIGVTLLEVWRPLPFMAAMALTLALMVTFWSLRLADRRAGAGGRGSEPGPLGVIGRFFEQPRLISGWTFAVIRSSAWWVFTVYLPIYAVNEGLGAKLGGYALSGASALMFLTPLMLRWVEARSVRWAVRMGFMGAGLLFILATLLAGWPWAAVAALMVAAIFLVLLDMAGGLPFLLAVKPSERSEMAAIYSSFRDVSGILTPGLAWLVLLVAPLPGLFAAMGVLLLGNWLLAGVLHPMLGQPGARRHPRPQGAGAEGATAGNATAGQSGDRPAA
jgi:ACDE family multidrug resistance protein